MTMRDANDEALRRELRDHYLRHGDLAEAARQVERDDTLHIDAATAMALTRHLGARGLTLVEDPPAHGRWEAWTAVTLARYAELLREENNGKGAA